MLESHGAPDSLAYFILRRTLSPLRAAFFDKEIVMKPDCVIF